MCIYFHIDLNYYYEVMLIISPNREHNLNGNKNKLFLFTSFAHPNEQYIIT